MSDVVIPVNLLSLFSADRQVYRSFGYLIASRIGTLLLVPPRLVLGDISGVIDGCPVPGEEVYAVLEYPSNHGALVAGARPGLASLRASINDQVRQLEYLSLDPDEFEVDAISPMVRGEENVLRLVHPCGIRYAVAM